jgi:hypothetical protein
VKDHCPSALHRFVVAGIPDEPRDDYAATAEGGTAGGELPRKKASQRRQATAIRSRRARKPDVADAGAQKDRLGVVMQSPIPHESHSRSGAFLHEAESGATRNGYKTIRSPPLRPETGQTAAGIEAGAENYGPG